MKIGVVFPQIEFGSDTAAIRDYTQTAEASGYAHILAYDHILGANPDRPEPRQGTYTYKDPFHEPFLLFSYMAALTQTIEFVTGILILPQRETALVAKQAAELDVLRNGRFRADVGIEARIAYGDGNPKTWRHSLTNWQSAGASHITLNTMYLGFDTPETHHPATMVRRKMGILRCLLAHTHRKPATNHLIPNQRLAKAQSSANARPGWRASPLYNNSNDAVGAGWRGITLGKRVTLIPRHLAHARQSWPRTGRDRRVKRVCV